MTDKFLTIDGGKYANDGERKWSSSMNSIVRRNYARS